MNAWCLTGKRLVYDVAQHISIYISIIHVNPYREHHFENIETIMKYAFSNNNSNKTVDQLLGNSTCKYCRLCLYMKNIIM